MMKVRKRCVPDNGERSRLYQLYDKTSFEYFEVSEQIFQKAVEQFGSRINNSVLLAFSIDECLSKLSLVLSIFILPFSLKRMILW